MKKKRKNTTFKKFIIVLVLIGIFGTAGMVYELYTRIFQPNITYINNSDVNYIYIPSNSNFSDVVDILSNNGLLINSNSFEWLAKQKKYHTQIKAGKYKIEKGLNNNELVDLLRSGKQIPVNIRFNNLRTIEELVAVVSKQIEADSISILNYINDSIFLKNLGLNSDNIACIFLPNTYEFYWNTSAKEFVDRMLKEYNYFWNQNRLNKASKINLNRNEVSILASIVEKEQSIRVDERPKIAALYLNRIRKKMKLESDPTLIYAIGDYSIKRVLNKDKKVESLYNTYKYKGLPPGPICLPSINAIDAVLNSDSHNFVFMCAKEDFSGYHNFAKTYAKHLIYARKYQKALNKKNIKR
ncbi:MAG: endolytic transglycosylase MltG [Flavobacteriales bacterium]|nr:endolytic transglycosylase MltG [Flavobacteriales bacterium]